MDEASTKLKLKRQNKGGMGNLAGNTYESHFAIWRVLLAVEQLRDGALSRLALQLRNSPVDDWVEELERERRHFQLKNKKDVRWSEVSAGFFQQWRSGRRKGRTLRVVLVVPSQRQSRTLARSKKAIARVEVRYFPSAVRPQDLFSRQPVQLTLRAACVERSPTSSDLEAIWSSIDFAWQKVRKPGRFVPIGAVLGALPDRELPLRQPWRPFADWRRAERVLRQVDGFSFGVRDGHFTYSDGTGTDGRKSCRISDFRGFVQRVLKQRPKNLAAVQDIL